MVTGGWRTARAMNAALEQGTVDLVGLGRPFCLDALVAHQLLSGVIDTTPNVALSLGLGSAFDRDLIPGLNNLYHVRQLRKLATGETTRGDLSGRGTVMDLVQAPLHYLVDPQQYPTQFRVGAFLWMCVMMWWIVSRVATWRGGTGTGSGRSS